MLRQYVRSSKVEALARMKELEAAGYTPLVSDRYISVLLGGCLLVEDYRVTWCTVNKAERLGASETTMSKLLQRSEVVHSLHVDGELFLAGLSRVTAALALGELVEAGREAQVVPSISPEEVMQALLERQAEEVRHRLLNLSELYRGTLNATNINW